MHRCHLAVFLCVQVGRIVLAGNAPFYAPANNRPCVYYHIVVREERRRVRFETIRDQAGNERTEERIENYWVEIANEERTSDYYLQDGMFKVFIQGSPLLTFFGVFFLLSPSSQHVYLMKNEV